MRDDESYKVSSFCSDGGCLGMTLRDGDVEIAKLPARLDSPAIRVSRDEWNSFLLGVKNGEFDLD